METNAKARKGVLKMVLKFLDRPQLGRNPRGGVGDDWSGRFPQGQPIATAPQNSGTPVWVMQANGQGSWALHYGGGWKKLSPFKDSKSGGVQWRMDGTMISNPVAWSLPRKK
jgi:hypothetical protein